MNPTLLWISDADGLFATDDDTLFPGGFDDLIIGSREAGRRPRSG